MTNRQNESSINTESEIECSETESLSRDFSQNQGQSESPLKEESPIHPDHQQSKQSMDLVVEPFNIAAFIKADCMASMEREKKENAEETELPTLNISRYVDQGENEPFSGFSHRTNEAEPKVVIHDRNQTSAFNETENYEESCPVTIKK